MALARGHQVHCGAIRKFNESTIIDGDDSGRTRLYQRPQLRFRPLTQTSVAHHLSDEQPAADKGESLKAEANQRRFQCAKQLSQISAACAEQCDEPPRKEGRNKHDREKVKEAQREVGLRPPVHRCNDQDEDTAREQNPNAVLIAPQAF